MELIFMIAIVFSIAGVAVYDACEKLWRRHRRALRRRRAAESAVQCDTIRI